MIKLRLIICLSITFFCIKKAAGQYAVAGTSGGIYQDIVPDTLLNPTLSLSGAVFELLNIDINQDGINDMEIKAYGSISSGHTYIYGIVTALNSSTNFSFGSIDSTFYPAPPPPATCGSWWETRTILKIHNSGDTISDQQYVSSGFLGYKRQQGSGACAHTAESPQWKTGLDAYIGVRYITNTDTSYGWVKVNVLGYYSVKIKEYSLGTPSYAGILSVTDGGNPILIYPNPVSSTIQLSMPGNRGEQSEIEILDLLGKTIKSITSATKESVINISDLPNGFYLVRARMENNILTKKIIVQH